MSRVMQRYHIILKYNLVILEKIMRNYLNLKHICPIKQGFTTGTTTCGTIVASPHIVTIENTANNLEIGLKETELQPTI